MSKLHIPPENPNTAVWVDFEMPAIQSEVVQGIQAARSALGSATLRAAKDRMQAQASWEASVEAVWWTTSLDDLFKVELGGEYCTARNDDDCGVVVHAFRWIRHRHAHEVVSTATAGPARDFLPPPGSNYVVFISSSIRWKRSEDVHTTRDQQPQLRPLYDEHVGGYPIDQTLRSAERWFDRIMSACSIPHLPGSDDPSVLP